MLLSLRIMAGSLLVEAPELERKGIVFGVDEVGRGCLAGPVVAACVAFDWSKPEVIIELNDRVVIRDSKLMSRAQRVEAAKAIREVAVSFGIGEVDSATIDEINILQATFEAMRKAVGDATDGDGCDGYERAHHFIDGNQRVPGVDWEQEAIVDGDAKVFSIAAASIIAKEYRDSLMEVLHETYPQYGFAQHKGYGTKQHYAAIVEHGIIAEHRKSFLKKLVV
jgi:ribonuclease HII